MGEFEKGWLQWKNNSLSWSSFYVRPDNGDGGETLLAIRSALTLFRLFYLFVVSTGTNYRDK